MTEPEPIYEYIKGKGWMVLPPEILTMDCGTRVQLLFRKPTSEERGTWNDVNSNWSDENWRRWVERGRYDWIETGFELGEPRGDIVWVTLVPL